MPLEQQLTSLALSQKLREMGVPQVSYFWWFPGVRWEIVDGVQTTSDVWLLDHKETQGERYSAFTVSELYALLRPFKTGELVIPFTVPAEDIPDDLAEDLIRVYAANS